MKRYHFSIAGTMGHIGLAGAIFAESDDKALATLQETLDDLQEYVITDNYAGVEPDLDQAPAGLSYVAFYGNDIRAVTDMFDEIDDAAPASACD